MTKWIYEKPEPLEAGEGTLEELLQALEENGGIRFRSFEELGLNIEDFD
jgi:hypothetical protein